jgi:hypothetical protein
MTQKKCRLIYFYKHTKKIISFLYAPYMITAFATVQDNHRIVGGTFGVDIIFIDSFLSFNQDYYEIYFDVY